MVSDICISLLQIKKGAILKGHGQVKMIHDKAVVTINITTVDKQIEYFQEPPNCLQSTSLGCFQNSTSSSPPTAFSPPALGASRPPTAFIPPALDASELSTSSTPQLLQSPALHASRIEYFQPPSTNCFSPSAPLDASQNSTSSSPPNCLQSTQPWMLSREEYFQEKTLDAFKSRVFSSSAPTAFSPPSLIFPSSSTSSSPQLPSVRPASYASRAQLQPAASQLLSVHQPWMLQKHSTPAAPNCLQSTSLGCFRSRVLPAAPQLLSVHQPWMLPKQRSSSSPPTAFSPPALDASRVEYFQQTPNCFQSTSHGCFQIRVLPAAPPLPSVHQPKMLPDPPTLDASRVEYFQQPPTAFSPPALDASRVEYFQQPPTVSSPPALDASTVQYFQQPPNCLQSTSLGCFPEVEYFQKPPTAFNPPSLYASRAEYFQLPPNCLQSASLGCFQSRDLPAGPPTAFSPPALDVSRVEYFQQHPNCLQSTSLGYFQSRVLSAAPQLPSVHQPWMLPEQSTSSCPPTAFSPPALDSSRVEYFQQTPNCFQSTSLGCFQNRVLPAAPQLPSVHHPWMLPELSTSSSPLTAFSPPALDASRTEYFQQPPNCLQSTSLGCFQKHSTSSSPLTAFSPQPLMLPEQSTSRSPPTAFSPPALDASKAEIFQQPPNCLQSTSLGCFQTLDASRVEYCQQPPNCLQSTSLGCFDRVLAPKQPPATDACQPELCLGCFQSKAPNCLQSTCFGSSRESIPQPPTAFSPPALDDSRAEFLQEPSHCLHSTSLG
ncbi:uncharacterized protein LOC135211477 [Macrobrachium nipponense]|uniref:uncharacterized protein LOC135211477 n=1 Tax=Macrobrachium nipponense TaxID=159736 RepID=UPI0030C85C7A